MSFKLRVAIFIALTTFLVGAHFAVHAKGGGGGHASAGGGRGASSAGRSAAKASPAKPTSTPIVPVAHGGSSKEDEKKKGKTK